MFLGETANGFLRVTLSDTQGGTASVIGSKPAPGQKPVYPHGSWAVLTDRMISKPIFLGPESTKSKLVKTFVVKPSAETRMS